MKKRVLKSRLTHRTGPRKKPRLLVLGIIIFLLSSIFIFGNHGLIKYAQLQYRKKALLKQIAVLKEEQQHLEQEIDMLQNNYRYIEKIAREKYQMGKEGEKIYFIIQVPATDKKPNRAK